MSYSFSNLRFSPYPARIPLQKQLSGSTSLAESGSSDESSSISKSALRNRAELIRRCSDSMLNQELMLFHLFCASLKQQDIIDDLAFASRDLATRFERLEDLIGKDWKLPRSVEYVIEAIIWHFITTPARSYDHLEAVVNIYIEEHANDIQLTDYHSNPMVCCTVRNFVNSKIQQIRVLWHDEIHLSIQTGSTMSVEAFAQQVMERHYIASYHEVPRVRIAFYAMMRLACYPSPDEHTRNVFWRSLEVKLSQLWDLNGSDLKSKPWERWFETVIDADHRYHSPAPPHDDSLDLDLFFDEKPSLKRLQRRQRSVA
ncbi:hypothetical protein BT96DRAFT_945939 [Gymnopus androsaceus JB14]|uniref:Uncharacterized protein n=1 Tax=Gymnopus androsaceus JB14 TaxID=1447944 RepID=A0A6A4GZZ5_9AGAR|nr:hypothetical protein BT96DRAFT_945939 [Gymnopus androsaceus JB14]